MAGLRSARMGLRLAAAFGAVGVLLVAVVVVALLGLRSEGRSVELLAEDQGTAEAVLQRQTHRYICTYWVRFELKD